MFKRVAKFISRITQCHLVPGLEVAVCEGTCPIGHWYPGRIVLESGEVIRIEDKVWTRGREFTGVHYDSGRFIDFVG